MLVRDDFRAPENSEALREIERLPGLRDRVKRFHDLCCMPLRDLPLLEDFRQERYSGARTQPLGKVRYQTAIEYEEYSSPIPVVDGMSYLATERHVGEPIQLVGCVQRVFRSGNITSLRFGPNYNHTPLLVVPNHAFDLWAHAKTMEMKPWISATGVLQRHRSGHYTTVQITVRETSDIEILPSKDHADYRLGRKRLRKTIRRPKLPTGARRPSEQPDLPDWVPLPQQGSQANRLPPRPESGRAVKPSPTVAPNSKVIPDWVEALHTSREQAVPVAPSSAPVPKTTSPHMASQPWPSSPVRSYSARYCYLEYTQGSSRPHGAAPRRSLGGNSIGPIVCC